MPAGGVVLVRRAERRAYVPTSVARQIVPQSTISRVPNSSLGMTLVGGRVVSVVELGEASGALLVCELDGDPIALSGLYIERVGWFEIDERGAYVDGDCVPALSLEGLPFAPLATPPSVSS
jgi:hypothetical protein